MNKVFGEKKNVEYYDREGVYLIPVEGNKIGVIKTPKGYFLLGGGLENNETDEECIIRECMEETGYEVCVGEYICSAETYCEHPRIGHFHPIQKYYSGKLVKKKQMPVEKEHVLVWLKYDELRGRLFAEMQNWAVEQCWEKRK